MDSYFKLTLKDTTIFFPHYCVENKALRDLKIAYIKTQAFELFLNWALAGCCFELTCPLSSGQV